MIKSYHFVEKKKKLAGKGAEQIQLENTYQGHYIFLIRVTYILI